MRNHACQLFVLFCFLGFAKAGLNIQPCYLAFGDATTTYTNLNKSYNLNFFSEKPKNLFLDEVKYK